MNWGRATKSCLRQLEVLQNRFIKASLILLRNSSTNLLYFKFEVPKLKGLVKIESVKWKMPNSCLNLKTKCAIFLFGDYFTNLNEIHKYNTRQKVDIIIIHLTANYGENNLIMNAYDYENP